MSQSPKDIAERIINEPLRASLSPAHQIVDLARAYLELEDQLERVNDIIPQRDRFALIIDDLKSEITKLKEEIEILRRYGNKDCTAMADEELERLKNG